MGKKKNSDNNNSGKRVTGNFLKDERFKFTIGLLITCFSVLIFLSLISYLFTWTKDADFECSKVFSGSPVHNWAGKVGACLAKLLINRWFGIASFLIPFIILILGLALLNIKFLPLGKTIRITLVATIILSAWFGFLFREYDTSDGHKILLGSGLGGKHGQYVSEWLIGFIGKTGTSFLLLIVTFALIIFSFKNSFGLLRTLFNYILKKSVRITAGSSAQNQTGSDEIELDTGNKSEDLVFETEFPLRESADNNMVNEITGTGEENEAISREGENFKDEPDDLIDIEELEDYDPTLELGSFKLASLDLLEKYEK